MRAVVVTAAFLLVFASLGGAAADGVGRPTRPAAPIRLAGLYDSAAGMFLRLVNEKLRGRIDPRSIDVDAPASLILQDVVLSDPSGGPVARVKRARVTLSLAALLIGEVAISRLEVDEPELLLGVKDGRLNIIEALSPREPKNKKQKGSFRIDNVVIRDGGFRFRDETNVTVVADDIDLQASLEVFLESETVTIDVSDAHIATGSVRLPELDVPFFDVRAPRLRFTNNRLEVPMVTAQALRGSRGGSASGADVSVSGIVDVSAAGRLGLAFTVASDAGAWPERLERLPFPTPRATAQVSVTGPLREPTVSIDGTFDDVTVYGYPITGGVAKVEVARSRVRILKGSAVRVGGAAAFIDGDVMLTDLALALNARTAAAPLAVLLTPAKLESAPQGTVTGTARITGHAKSAGTIEVRAELDLKAAELLSLRTPTTTHASTFIQISQRRVLLQQVELSAPGFSATASGELDSEKETLSLDVVVAAEDATELVPALPDELHADAVTLQATVRGPTRNLAVAGVLDVSKGSAYGVPLEKLKATFLASPREVRIQQFSGRAAEGVARMDHPFVVDLTGPHPMLSGVVDVARFRLNTLRGVDGKPLPLAGVATLRAVIQGRADRPIVDLRAAGGGIFVSGEPLGEVTATARFTKDELRIRQMAVNSTLTRATARDIVIGFDPASVDGTIALQTLDLSRIVHAADLRLRGTGRGTARLSGRLRAPKIVGDLRVRNLAIDDTELGDGRISVGIAPDTAAARDGALIAQFAGILEQQERGLLEVRASWSLDREVLAAEASFREFELGPWAGRLLGPDRRWIGRADGTLSASGPLDALNARISVSSADLAVEPPATGSGAAAEHDVRRSLGPFLVDLQLEDGALDGMVCAFPYRLGFPKPVPDQGASRCDGAHRLWATAAGKIALRSGRWDVHVTGQIDEDRLRDLVPALTSRDVDVDLSARISARITRAGSAAPTSLSLKTHVNDAAIRVAGTPGIHLASPIDVDYADGGATIVGGAHGAPARFVTASGDVDMSIGAGSTIGTEGLDVTVDGDVALAALKLLTTQVANASGTATTHLRARGRYADGLEIDGTITPTPGSTLTARSLGQQITFLAGSIAVAPHAEDPSLLVLDFAPPCDGKGRERVDCPLRLAMGEGAVGLQGTVDLRTSRRSDDDSWLERFSLDASGSSLEVRTPGGRVQSSFDLSLAGDRTNPVLRGRIEVTEGTWRKDFQIRNFVLSQAPDKPSESMVELLQPFGLSDLVFDVDLSLQNFRTRARLNAFSVDASLRGELHVSRTLRLPSVDGAIEVEEGTVVFPRARFEVAEMQAQFPTSPEGRIRPVLHLTARAEIPPGAAGNDVEFPIDLSLDGTFDAMQLDLTAADPGRQWTRTELFTFVLFGRPPDEGFAATSVQAAREALLRELAAPMTGEVEDIVSLLGVDVELDLTGFQLQLGRRLVMEGAGFTALAAATTDSATSVAANGTNSTDALRVRLLIVDHLQVGRALSVEGRVGTVSDLRLSFRIFEK